MPSVRELREEIGIMEVSKFFPPQMVKWSVMILLP